MDKYLSVIIIKFMATGADHVGDRVSDLKRIEQWISNISRVSKAYKFNFRKSTLHPVTADRFIEVEELQSFIPVHAVVNIRNKLIKDDPLLRLGRSKLKAFVFRDAVQSEDRADGLSGRVQAFQEALLDGRIDSVHAAEALELLKARIAAHPEFFGGGGWNEAAIFDSDGSEYRPDRVVIRGDSALVVDYKFGGHEKRYAAQVRRYMRLCRELGFKDVKGCVWYVPEDEIDYICSL